MNGERMPMKIQAVFFDLGETLLNYGRVNMARMFRAGAHMAYEYLQELGHTLPPFERYVFWKNIAVRYRYLRSHLTQRDFNSLEVLARLHADMQVPLTQEQAVELAWRWYLPLRGAAAPDPDALDVLRRFRDAGLVMGLISNTFLPPEVLDRHLTQEGMLEFLTPRVYSSTVRFRKPNARIFRIALQQAGVEPAETLFVGDSPGADVQGANRAGLVSVLKDPFDAFARRGPVANHRIRRLAELIEIVDERNRR